jgi:hypothetical protein
MNSTVKPVVASGVSVAAALAVILTAVPAAYAGAGTATGQADGTCPSTVVLAGRGSEQNQVTYPGGPLARYSNGWEGEPGSHLLTFTLAEHPEILDDGTTQIIGITDEHYPARFPLPKSVADVTPAGLVQSAQLTTDSVIRSFTGGQTQVDDWEATTGCRPDYITVGYSQGELPMLGVQRDLAEEGRLRGVLAFGNPLHHLPGARGFPGVPRDVPSLDYCVPDDVVCDTSVRSAFLALTDPDDAGVHADYFEDAVAGGPSAGDRHVADTLADWLSR